MTLSISERHIERLIDKLEEFFAGIGEVTVLEDLMNAEDEVPVVPVQPVEQADSEDEWRHRRRDQQRGEDVRQRRRWNARRGDQERHRREEPPAAFDGDMRGYRVGEERRDHRRHERFAMDTGSDVAATPRADDDPDDVSRVSAPGSEAERPAEQRAEEPPRLDRARRPFGRVPRRARSASPQLGRTRSRDRVERRVETPVLAAPKMRARRGASPRRLDGNYPPLGHG